MKIEIFDVDNTLGIEFGYWLTRKMKSVFQYKVDLNKLSVWNDVLEKDIKYQTLDGSPISCYSILLQGFDNLIVDKLPEKLIIRFNNNKFVTNMNHVKLDVICRLINFGTTTVRGYPILTDVFSDVVNNINDYVDEYLSGV